MSINQKQLKKAGAKAGILRIGAADTRQPDSLLKKLQRRAAEGRVTPFEEQNLLARISPEKLLPDCRSIIVIAIPYAAPEKSVAVSSDQPRGLVARCARALDYHDVVKDRAEAIIRIISDETKNPFHYRILCDSSPLVERELAFRAGIGHIGDNCTLITDLYGSFTVLGTILVNKEIETGEPSKKTCINCQKCREACPTGALQAPFIINPYLCLSYLTQAPGVFPREMRPLLGNRIYGCDECQNACPLNKERAASPFAEFAFNYFPAEPFLLPMLEMTGKEYALTVGLTSAGWRGKTTLQRNVIIALGNSGDPRAVKPLARLLENDSRPLIRLHSAWALGRIGGSGARFYLEKARHHEIDPAAREEVEISLEEQ
ncbi:MAG: tRNA epoxyqueuosine(34) reductase QueG [Bacillota bacterium]